jgi:hypothetical protein
MRVPIRLNTPSKYRAVRTEGYGSRKEANRAGELEAARGRNPSNKIGSL